MSAATRRVTTKLERKVLRELRWYDQAILLDDSFHDVPLTKRPNPEKRRGSFRAAEVVRRLAEETRQPEGRVREQVQAFLDQLTDEGVVQPWHPSPGRDGWSRQSFWIDRDLLAEHHPTPQQETR